MEQSWTNIPEHEEVEQKLFEALETDNLIIIDIPANANDFQVVNISEGENKGKKTSHLKSNYRIIGKISNPKPFR